jgi:hypothetical protein
VTQPSASPHPPAPPFVVRIAGLAMDGLDRLRAPRTMQLIDALVEAQGWIAAQSGPLAAALHRLVGGNEDTDLRRRLISLKRDAFHGRLPRGGRPALALLAALPPGLAAEIERWYARLEQRRDLLARAERELATETQEARRALRELAADDTFQQGLVLASPGLYAELAKEPPSAGEPKVAKIDRKRERRLLKYLARAASKTSPFSTFTSSAEGRWSGDAPLSCRVTSALSARRSVVELNAFTQRQLRRTIALWPEVRPHLRLTVNSSLIEASGVVRFLGRREQEAVVELAHTPTLRRFLDEVRSGPDRSHGGVVRSLAEQDPGSGPEAIARFLDRLIDLGLIEASLDLPELEVDPLGRLEQELGRFEGPRPRSVRGLIGGLRGDLQRYAALAAPAERFEQARTIRTDLTRLYHALGWDPSGEQFPEEPFYEDTLLPGLAVGCSASAWRPVLGALGLVQRLAGLYDRCLPGRLAAAAFFEDRRGRGARVRFLDFYAEFCQEIRQPAGWRQGHRVSGADLLTCYEEPFPVPQVGLPELADLAARQRQVASYFAQLPVDAAGIRRADPGAVRDLIAGFPAFVAPIESAALHGQVLLRDGRPQVVLNELAMGFGRTRARLLRLDEMSGGGVFAGAASAAPASNGQNVPGRQAAEVAGALGSNLNLRRPTAPLEIDYPGCLSGRPPGERVPLQDLFVEVDAPTGRLRLLSERRRIEITPVHLGSMVEFLLPPAYRFLIQIFGQAVPRFEFIKALATASPHREQEGVRRFPRLYLGDVVLNRALWAVPVRHLPRREKGETELAFLLRLTGWRRRQELPDRCFVRVFAMDFRISRSNKVKGRLDKSRKPLFIDFASPLFLSVLEHVAADLEPDRLVLFEEMLPAADDLVVRDASGSYASELIIELTIPEGT